MLGTAAPLWHEALKNQEEFQVTPCEISQDLDWPDPGTMDVFVLTDLATVQAYPNEPGQHLHVSQLLLLMPVGLSAAVVAEWREKCSAIFFYQPNQPLSVAEQQNFLVFLEQAFQVQTVNSRLSEYIADAFQYIVDTHMLQVQKEQIEQLNLRLEELSRTDALTRLLNRRALMDAFELEKKRAIRNRWRLSGSGGDLALADSEIPSTDEAYNQGKGRITDHIGNFACLMVDIDHFKQVNDKHGHLAGDDVLQKFGEIVHTPGLFRENDIIGRYGGEEFVILLPETNSTNALIPAERLRQAIKEVEFLSETKGTFSVTISVGVAEFQPEEVSVKELISRADQALYYAKEHGRDQICVYSSTLFPKK